MTEQNSKSNLGNAVSQDRLLHSTLQDAASLAFKSEGLALVPIEPTIAMLRALDEGGDRIWDGGTEHYFRNEEEAFWYARQVWNAMIRASQLPAD
jgi:hypothetical protein